MDLRMERLARIEKWCLWGHGIAMAFGLAGLLLVMPHPQFLEHVPAGPLMYRWSMAGGGVVYILLGTVAVALHTYRTLGLRTLLTFLIPAVALSLASELSGTSTGFPFGDYSYLNGLGYKVAGLVPFTIPLSWFYLGISSYLLARGGLLGSDRAGLFRHAAALATGAVLLMSWDFVLDPAMSQTALPFWYWHTPGPFFGMPYRNFAGWFGTGVTFMAVAALFWAKGDRPITLTRPQLNTPLAVYLANFTFAMVMSLAAGIWVPVGLGLLVGAIPAILCWWATPDPAAPSATAPTADRKDLPLPMAAESGS